MAIENLLRARHYVKYFAHNGDNNVNDNKKYNGFSPGTRPDGACWVDMPVVGWPGGRGWTRYPQGPSSISPSSEGPTTSLTRPDSKTQPLGEVERQQDTALHSPVGQRERGAPALDYSPVPPLTGREATKAETVIVPQQVGDWPHRRE